MIRCANELNVIRAAGHGGDGRFLEVAKLLPMASDMFVNGNSRVVTGATRESGNVNSVRNT